MKPFFEKVRVNDGCSWTVFDRRLESFPFEWHYHPEYELTLTLNSRGQRYIGDHIAAYGDGDLVLVGPNLPHTWCSREKIDGAAPHRAIVLWFHPSLAEEMIARRPEFAAVQGMLSSSASGLAFDGKSRKRASQLIRALPGLAPCDRLISLLSILSVLAEGRVGKPLSSAFPNSVQKPLEDQDSIDRVLAHIHKHYREPIALDDLAECARASVSTLQRLFKRHARMPITDYIAQLRLGQACSMMINSEKPITIIAEEVGYHNYANFERQFRKFKSVTPREFRQSFRQR
ncbi:MAG TPA: AraC family transcriptional regulator [Bryobacteraceae bacterium]|nr:AraC family transcriptional regulator [Bryobacteraceae bacterium]